MEKILLSYVCPSLELMEEDVEWEEIKEEEKLIKEYDNLCKTLDNLSEDEQLDYLSDMICNALFE